MKAIGIVILNWNRYDLTIRCIESVLGSTYSSFRIFIVDNGSTDDSVERLRESIPRAEVICNKTNLGFATGTNQGMRLAFKMGCDSVLILNNDTIVDPLMIESLLDCVSSEKGNAVASPRMFLDGPDTLWFTHGVASLRTGVFSNPAHGRKYGPGFDRPLQMDWGSGCCLLIPRKVYDIVGGFDDRFFAYCEDIDWTLRCREHGFRLLYCPTAKLWHWAGTAAKHKPVFYRYLSTRNHLWVMRKHVTGVTFLCFCLIFPARVGFRLSKLVLSGSWSGIGAELRGVWDGFTVCLDDTQQKGYLERTSSNVAAQKHTTWGGRR